MNDIWTEHRGLCLFLVAVAMLSIGYGLGNYEAHVTNHAPACTHGTSSAGPITLHHGKLTGTTPIHMRFCQR